MSDGAPPDEFRLLLGQQFVSEALQVEGEKQRRLWRELEAWESNLRMAERNAARRDEEMRERFALAKRSQWFALVSLLAALGTTLALA